MISPRKMKGFYGDNEYSEQIYKNYDFLNHTFEDNLDNFKFLEKLDADNKHIYNFLGDSDDSTEISLILTNLNTSLNNTKFSNQKNLESELNTSKSEILKILKFKRQPNTITISSRGNVHAETPFSLTHSTKKISMAGRILKDNNSNKTKNDSVNSFIPERLSNPILRNFNLNHPNQSTVDFADKNEFFKSSW